MRRISTWLLLLTIVLGGGAPASAAARAGAPGVALAQESATGGLRGRVVAADGAPVDGAVATVTAAPDAPCADAGTCPAPAAVLADGQGRWRAQGLAAGDYTVHARDPQARFGDRWYGDRTDSGEAVRVAAGQEVAGVDVTLRPAASVTGTVRSTAGTAVGGVPVRILRTAFLTVETTTGTDGRFRLDGLPGAVHRVEARPAGSRHGPADVDVTVADGAAAHVEIELPPGTLAVDRIAGATRIDTAVAASRAAFPDAPRVVLASATTFADALAAAPLAARLEGPLLLTGGRLPPAVLGEIRRLGATEVVVVGAFGAVPTVVSVELRAAGLAVRRIAGENRFDTAALIARELGSRDAEAFVVNGGAFPDALSVAPLAAAGGIPIILVERDRLPPDAAAALVELAIERTVVVGGPAAVSDAVLEALPGPTRVAGEERYATALAVAELARERGMPLARIGVATGREFPDALTAGPTMAVLGGPLLLVDGTNPRGAAATFAFVERHLDEIGSALAFGGSVAIRDAVLDRLRQLGGPP